MIKKQLQIFILGWAILFGFLVRATPAFINRFPLNDGGMFFTIVEDLISTNFIPPEVISYNGLGIPFTYPPLAFYILAILSKNLGISLIQLFIWMPVVFSTFSIVAIYFLAKEITNDSLLASFSALGFAMLPATMTWLVMGGGVTRSLGIVFSLLTMLFAYRLYKNGKSIDCILTSLFASLLVLSHSEWTIQTVAAIIVFFVNSSDKKKSAFISLPVVVSTIILTSIYWIRIFKTHSFSPFHNAISSGFYDFSNLLPPVMFTIGREMYFPIISILGIFGLSYLVIRRREFWYLAWFIVPFIADPRIAFSAVAIPLSITSSYGLFILVQLFDFFNKSHADELWIDRLDEQQIRRFWSSKLSKWIIGYIIIYSLVGSFGNILQNSDVVLNEEVRQSFEWISDSIPSNSNFLVITGEPLFNNPIQEWFHPLTKSNSITTYQGTEWLPGYYYYAAIASSLALQDCKFRQLPCLEDWKKTNPFHFEFIYIYQGAVPTLGLGEESNCESLAQSFEQSDRFTLVYESKNIKIFRVE